MKKIASLILASLIVWTTHALASELKSVIDSCNDCHGIDGISQEPTVPTIAGFSALTLEYAMYAYVDKMRPAAEMNGTNMIKEAEKLSENQIVELAGYYSQLPFKAAKQEYNPELAAKGEKIHQKKCDNCHSEGGSNPDDDAAIIAGQWKPYLESEIAYMISGKRETDEKMVKALTALKPEYVEMLLHYYASQQ